MDSDNDRTRLFVVLASTHGVSGLWLSLVEHNK